MTREEAIIRSKHFRVGLDHLLQEMKEYKADMLGPMPHNGFPFLERYPEAFSQNKVSIRDLEGAIMRQGMVLKNLNVPNPYPDSYKPENSIVNPTADGLKL